MDDKKLKELISKALLKDARVCDKTEGGEINLDIPKVFELLEKHDIAIMDSLFQIDEIKNIFFSKGKSAYIFKTNYFRFFLEGNEIGNSYTDYDNRIGLAFGKNKFIKYNSDVVVDFPYKDCILEGGQSTEEGMDIAYGAYSQEDGYQKGKVKRKEIFYNSILAQDEIDRLLDEKAFVNWSRYTKSKKDKVKKINRNSNGSISENLVINGNNLLTLHSLKKEFWGKVKLVYIDPPYNTGGPENIFTYNNTFNHSTWLTFMKNRLDIAKKLLRNDGFIAIAIDHCELGYLIVLCDEIFGKENMAGIVSVRHFPGGRTDSKYFSINSEFMLVYAMSPSSVFNMFEMTEETRKKYKFKDEVSLYYPREMMRDGDVNSRPEDRKNLYYPIYVSQDLKEFSLEKKDGYIEVLPTKNDGSKRVWDCSKQTFNDRVCIGDIEAKRNSNRIIISRKIRESNYKGRKLPTIWYESRYAAGRNGKTLLSETLGYQTDFSYPKSLYTVLDTLKLMTSGDDIILDFFAGSGTTGHAALALNKEDGGNRKFILVEQVDQHLNVCKDRISKVIKSLGSDVSFVYSEMAKWNEEIKNKILESNNIEDIEVLWKELSSRYFINYNVQVDNFNKILQEDGFRNLPLSQQKRMFLEMLDLNQLYVNKSEMKDKKYNLNQDDIKITEDFYGDGH